jgi:hypothetical protein
MPAGSQKEKHAENGKFAHYFKELFLRTFLLIINILA